MELSLQSIYITHKAAKHKENIRKAKTLNGSSYCCQIHITTQ